MILFTKYLSRYIQNFTFTDIVLLNNIKLIIYKKNYTLLSSNVNYNNYFQRKNKNNICIIV